MIGNILDKTHYSFECEVMIGRRFMVPKLLYSIELCYCDPPYLRITGWILFKRRLIKSGGSLV